MLYKLSTENTVPNNSSLGVSRYYKERVEDKIPLLQLLYLLPRLFTEPLLRKGSCTAAYFAVVA
jgi:hypothetical protein